MPTEKESFPKVEKSTFQEKITKVEKFFKSLAEMPHDFYAETRVDEPPQERKAK